MKRVLFVLFAVLMLASCQSVSAAQETASESQVPELTGTAATISKYGNVETDIASSAAAAAGFTPGDMVSVTAGTFNAVVPFGTNYTDVDRGNVLVVDGGTVLAVAISYGDFATTYSVSEGDSITIAMAEKGGYADQYMIRHLERTDNREDYSSDEVFANFRGITAGNVGEGVLYRSCSPVRGDARAPYADALLGNAGIKTVINLADSEESLQEHLAEAPNYRALADEGHVIALNMGVDFFSVDFTSKLHDGLVFMSENEGPYLIHCNEGKDRAGMVSALLEALAGASMDEIIADYMLSYENYYGVEKGSEQYDAIAKIITDFFQTMNGRAFPYNAVETVARNYVINTVGLTESQLTALVENITE